MQDTIVEKIQEILEKRHQQLSLAEVKLKRWKEIDQELRNLELVIDNLVNDANLSENLKNMLILFKEQAFGGDAKKCIEAFERVVKRIKRRTINIGVSGQARVGKSTLLQTLAGLDENQIPTGKGDPVTAVRSRIFHSLTNERATVKFHDYSSFRENILIPYHKKCNLDPDLTPKTLKDYEQLDYSLFDERISGLKPDEETLYKDLKNMHKSLSTYKKYLTGNTEEVPLSELRSFVSYPTKEQEDDNRHICPRIHLAVKDVKIECRFPNVNAENIALIDLPGLGELTVEADERHIKGLKNDVDLVLLVKRPSETIAFWKDEDSKTLNILDEARGAIKSRKDFIFIISNEGGCDEDLIKNMLSSISRKLNDAIDNSRYNILRSDVKNKDELYSSVILPVLKHLSERLPIMDNDILMDANEKSITTSGLIKIKIRELIKNIDNNISLSASGEEKVRELEQSLISNVARGLRKLKDEHRSKAKNKDDDDKLLKAIANVINSLDSWLNNGLGKGDMNKWIDFATDVLIVQGGSGKIAENEFNRIRVHISEHFSKLDEYFKTKVDELWQAIAKILRSELGRLLKDFEGYQALKFFSKLLNESAEPCPSFKAAVENLCNLKIEYHTQFHPRVRECLDNLRAQIKDSKTGDETMLIAVSDDRDGAGKLYSFISHLSLQAIYKTRDALIREANIIPLIIYCSCEQFDDSLIRSDNSEKEFGRLSRVYRSEIWHEIFKELDMNNNIISAVKSSVLKILTQLEDQYE